MSLASNDPGKPTAAPIPRELSALTPDFRKILDWVDKARSAPFPVIGPQAARAQYERVGGNLDLPLAPSDVVQTHELDLPGRKLSALLIAPHEPNWASPLPVLLYFHGGGFTVGSPKTHLGVCAALARLTECAVFSVDYRLAPEAPFPAAVDDAWDSLLWLKQHAESLGLDPQRVAIGGDSAGGTLTAVTAIRARDEGVALSHQLLVYPGTCAHQDTASHFQYAEGYLLERETILWFFEQVLQDPASREDWRFAPLSAANLQGVAPASVVIAECDTLADEGLAYADKLHHAGVATAVHVAQGAIHSFWQMGQVSEQARQAHRWAAQHLRQAFGLHAID